MADEQPEPPRVRVVCGDKDKKALLESPLLTAEQRQRLRNVIEGGMPLDAEDFYGHMALRDACKEGSATTPEDLGEWAAAGRAQWEKYLPVTAEGIHATEHPTIDVNQRAGEAIATMVAEEVFDVAVSDFTRIPENAGKGSKGKETFDFRSENAASLGDKVLQVEAKGTAFGASVSTQVGGIRSRKANPFVRNRSGVGLNRRSPRATAGA